MLRKSLKFLKISVLLLLGIILTSCQKDSTVVLPNLEGLTYEQIEYKMEKYDLRYVFKHTDDIIYSNDDLGMFRYYGDGLKAGDVLDAGSFIRIYTTVWPLTINRTHEVQMDFKLEKNQSFLETGKGKVRLLRTIDGDTAHFIDPYTTSSDNEVKVRFLGIDTPESTMENDPWGKAASQYTKQILSNASEIILESEGGQKDTYGRYLAWVWVDGKLLNLMIVQQAYSNSTAPLSSKYGEIMLEVSAQVSKTGRRFFGEIDPNYDYEKGE